MSVLPLILAALVSPLAAQAPVAPGDPIVDGDRPAVTEPAAEPVSSADILRDAPDAPPPQTGVPVRVIPAAPATTTDFFADGQPGHYLAWYGAEYAAVATLAGLYLGKVHELIPPGPALIGPRFDIDRMDFEALMDPRLDGVIGKPFLKEQVPSNYLIGGAAILILGTTATDLAVTGDLHRSNALVLGGLEALMGTVLVTEVFKLSFGRLRPDFRDRYLHAACGGAVDVPTGLDCSTVDDSLNISRRDLEEGMKSFVSGHSSSAFAMATFTSWWLGSTLVWADDAPAWGPAVGTLGMGGLMAGAGYVAATRLSDDKHHPEDVIVGGLVGATVASTVWLTHFDLDGRARRRSFTVVPATGMGQDGTGSGLAVVGVLP